MKIVFIVDDNDANLFAAQTALSEKYNVYTLPSAIAMFKLIEKVMPDLILMDIKMPEMDGFDAVKKLKADGRYADIPVIFLTGQTDIGVETIGFMLGAVDFIPKPFSEPVLQRRVQTQIDVEELLRERTQELRGQIEKLQLRVAELEKELDGFK